MSVLHGEKPTAPRKMIPYEQLLPSDATCHDRITWGVATVPRRRIVRPKPPPLLGTQTFDDQFSLSVAHMSSSEWAQEYGIAPISAFSSHGIASIEWANSSTLGVKDLCVKTVGLTWWLGSEANSAYAGGSWSRLEAGFAETNGGMETIMEDMKIEDGMRTPTMRSVNVADAFDWQQRANVAEHELAIQQSKLAREKGTNRRLHSQLISSIEGWTVTSQHMQVLVNSNYGYSQDILRLKSTIEALESIIERLFMASQNKERMSPSYVTADS
ncbi:hypothetical protein V498_06128 [Pseudogymnoascus sp. VKM F-4517 (FW-2822)]|nr:hypothetical protein V498_06128 [Pseudogymnoascus sp. VKM F-4517 (FW-2822)]